MTLYWSTLEMYEDCPQKFLWSRGWPGIDVGGGPGRKKPLPIQSSEHHRMMGQVIQKVIEDMYNNELWKHPQGLVDRLLSMVEDEYYRSLTRAFIDWAKAPTREEMLKVCKDGVSGFMRTLKANRLLGSYAKAEVDLIGWVDDKNPIGGRPDVIVRRDDTGVTILDGKNSQSKGKYTDPDQLRWYALCYYLAYRQMPDRLGFVYYRYPHDESTGESGVDWVPFTKSDIEGLAARAVEAKKSMIKQRFHADPTPKKCGLCDYQTVCDARIDQRTENAAKRKKNDPFANVEGYIDLDMGKG